MKYIKPTDFLSVREFKAEYQRIEESITELLAEDASARTADELNKRLQSALNAAVKYLSSVNAEFAKKELSTAFNEGKESSAKKAKTEKPKLTVAQANEILAKQGYKYSKTAFANDLYIELQTATESAGKGLKSRVNGIIEQLRKDGKDSVYNVQEAIKKDLQENGLLVVEYANGAKQTLDTYASMAARSARIETTNIGAIGRALQAGTDLVRMTSMPQCCKFCGAFQDKVYSISGKDKRFPALFKTVLRSGYALPHPNCRHEFIPYFEEMEAPEDVERMAKQSRIKYDKQGNLVDVRSQADIRSYQAWQAGNRQRNAELREYERMKAYYAGKGVDAPYSTLAAFRRARRAQSGAYIEIRKRWDTVAEQSKEEVLPYNQEIVDSDVYKTKFKGLGGKNVIKAVCKEARKCIHKNDKTTNERGVFIDKKGESVHSFEGNNLKASFGGYSLDKYEDNSLILLHNHPSGMSFSTDDILTLSDNPQVAIIIAVGHNGVIYKLSIGNGKRVDKSIVGEYNMLMKDTGKDRHKVMQLLAKRNNWSYEKL